MDVLEVFEDGQLPEEVANGLEIYEPIFDN
jgi:hypothetical protein